MVHIRADMLYKRQSPCTDLNQLASSGAMLTPVGLINVVNPGGGWSYGVK